MNGESKEQPKATTTKTTVDRVRLFIIKSNAYLKEFPEKTKLEYALTKQAKKYQPLVKEFNEAVLDYQEKISDAQADNASVDKDGVMLTNADGTFRYSPAGHKKLTRDLRKINDTWMEEQQELLEKEVEAETFIVDVKGVKLADTYVDAFTGFVI